MNVSFGRMSVIICRLVNKKKMQHNTEVITIETVSIIRFKIIRSLITSQGNYNSIESDFALEKSP